MLFLKKIKILPKMLPIGKLFQIPFKFFKKKKRISTTPSAHQDNLSKTVDQSRYVSVNKSEDGYKKPPFEWAYAYLFALFLGWLLADLGILSIRDKFIASSAMRISPQRAFLAKQPTRAEYNVITDRNIFSASGLIPPPLSSENQPNNEDLSNPVPSQLPMKLVGTIVHANPDRSVATVAMQGKVTPYIPNDDMDSLAKLLKVERHQAIFRNTQNGRLEYIEMKVEGLALPTKRPSNPLRSGRSSVRQQGNNFSLKRAEINQYMQNLPALLQQARAVPNMDPNTGAVNGFRLVDIQPGSVYEKLGLRRNDLIKAVNGEAVNDPAKAMQLYNSLKTDSNIAINIERNGRTETLNFSITE